MTTQVLPTCANTLKRLLSVFGLESAKISKATGCWSWRARLIEIVGEAANRLSDEVRSQHSEIPWPQIIGMRNRIVHAYDEVDLDLLWDTVTLELPPLIAQLERLLKC